MKYKNRLNEKIAEERAFEKEQQKLRKKYKVQDEGVIQIKKARLIEILIKNSVALIRVVATIILLILASIGLIALIYVNPRMELINIITEAIKQIR